ncbi:MAG TPA: hypothetical protein VFW44_22145 [Bryobacteraceae bacterium]|nr:hypothetical protein [Bryobacteraceae bacterium]
MKPNLDVLKPEIELYLEEAGMAVFYGFSRRLDSLPAVYWDCDQYPDYRLFVQSARSAGAKLMVFHQREFFTEQIDDAIEKLHACGLGVQESRHFEERLNDLRAYEGSVCAIELSFDHEGRAYFFDLRTEWFDEFTEIQDEVELLVPDDEASDDSPLGGYFSRN